MTHEISSLPFGWEVTCPDAEEPDRAADAFVAAVRAFAREAGIAELEVRALEPGRHPVRDGQRLTLDQAEAVVRRLLRHELWCKLESPDDDFAVHVGSDLHLYVSAARPCPEAAQATHRGLLFVQPVRSPYLPEPGEPPRDKGGVRSVHAWDDLQEVVAELRQVRALAPAETRAVADALADRYLAGRRARQWWWDALRDDVRVERRGYAGTFAWTAYLEEALPPRATYVLLVADEHAEPRGALEGTLQALAGVLHLAFAFGWAITTRDADFALFDTPAHELVLVEPRREPTPAALMTAMGSFAEAEAELGRLIELIAAMLRHVEATGIDRAGALWSLVDEWGLQRRLPRVRRLLGDVLARETYRPEREALQARIADVPVWSPADEAAPMPVAAPHAGGVDAIFAAAQILHQLVVSYDRWHAAHADLPAAERAEAYAAFFSAWAVPDRLAAARDLLERAR